MRSQTPVADLELGALPYLEGERPGPVLGDDPARDPQPAAGRHVETGAARFGLALGVQLDAGLEPAQKTQAGEAPEAAQLEQGAQRRGPRHPAAYLAFVSPSRRRKVMKPWLGS